VRSGILPQSSSSYDAGSSKPRAPQRYQLLARFHRFHLCQQFRRLIPCARFISVFSQATRSTTTRRRLRFRIAHDLADGSTPPMARSGTPRRSIRAPALQHAGSARRRSKARASQGPCARRTLCRAVRFRCRPAPSPAGAASRATCTHSAFLAVRRSLLSSWFVLPIPSPRPAERSALLVTCSPPVFRLIYSLFPIPCSLLLSPAFRSSLLTAVTVVFSVSQW
jgi:hypothetical protein